jgi:hypothetical protein
MEEYMKLYYNPKNLESATLLSDEIPEGWEEISSDEYTSIVKNMLDQAAESENTKQARITEIQNKAILEGLTDAEKEEYKKLKGGE